MHLHSERGIQVSCRIEHSMTKCTILQLLMNEKETELAQKQMKTCKQNHIKLKPARNENQPLRV